MASIFPREKLVYLAKVAEQAERYEEMVSYMETVASYVFANSSELTLEERNLLSAAYKGMIEPRRASLRIMSTIKQKEESVGNDTHVPVIREYRGRIGKEVTSICDGILKLIDDKLQPSANSGESKVYYLKMKGDYCRYLAEIKTSGARKEAAESCLNAYKAAQEIGNSELVPTHPLMLGLALNFSVFYFEILNSPQRACHLANQAVEEATTELDNLDEDLYKDSKMIMQLLRNNLTLWKLHLPDDKAVKTKKRIQYVRFVSDMQ